MYWKFENSRTGIAEFNKLELHLELFYSCFASAYAATGCWDSDDIMVCLVLVNQNKQNLSLKSWNSRFNWNGLNSSFHNLFLFAYTNWLAVSVIADRALIWLNLANQFILNSTFVFTDSTFDGYKLISSLC